MIAAYKWGTISKKWDTPSDGAVFEMVSDFLDGLAEQCGTPYEIVLHYENGNVIRFVNYHANKGMIVTGEVGHA